MDADAYADGRLVSFPAPFIPLIEARQHGPGACQGVCRVMLAFIRCAKGR